MWIKHGRIYAPKECYGWGKSHAQLPTVDRLDERWRIYFAARDEKGRAQTSYIETVAGNPREILYEHHEPILPLGEAGAFDDCGIMPAWIVNVGDRKYFYYTGWSTKITVPYHTAIGLAISDDNGRTFEKFSAGPIFGPTPHEPYITGSPCVMVEGGLWKCWYFSCTKWELINGKQEPFYHIKYAESCDGIDWQREGAVAIDYQSGDEAGIGRPSVLRGDGIYQMWYCYRKAYGYREDRKNSYRIGYAESRDGLSWVRLDDNAGIDISEDGWDSEMIAYPYVFEHDKRKYMFHNGNGFGRSGFGYAVLG
jgi:hypothetical protein